MERLSVEIRGIVQGVGFRPFAHRLAADLGLKGYIKNSSAGVELELEGPREALESFLRELPRQAPKLAVIESVRAEFSGELRGFQDFEILGSRVDKVRDTLVSPDIAVCDDCLRELRDPGDRRYRYPFINCTNCGPRFTIIKDVPYDRAKTSMGVFPMCPPCEREYNDITNRRYHAQPDCCPDCGPRLIYCGPSGRPVPGEALELARELVKGGGILAVKGLGGIHLACSCLEPETAERLRRGKRRDERPFAVMCRDVEAAKRLCHVSPAEEELLTGFRRPIVLLKKREKGMEHISENGYIGVMLPYTPLHYLLFGDDIDTLIMTSANLSDRPIMYKNSEALSGLRGVADGFLLHNREIQTRCDDSLLYVLDGREYPLRRSRGYVPFPIKVSGAAGQALACGAEQKASFCLSKGDYVFPSQHIGDLKNAETLENYESQIRRFQRLFDIEPRAIACDMHPDYLSAVYAEQRAEAEGLPLIRVQHHHAHMAACMADNGLTGPAVGLIWDGVGLGTDGTAWGGECLIGDYSGFERFGSIRPIPLPGGDMAVKETFRVAVSMLLDSGCDISGVENGAAIARLLRSGLHCPPSSGMGRLFDGAAAILGIKTRCSYEGQGAVLLEAAAAEGEEGSYPVEFSDDGGGVLRFDWRETARRMVLERDAGVSAAVLAARFMNTLIAMGAQQCALAAEKSGIRDVVLSGGTFQNMYIMRRLPGELRRRGLRPWLHSRVSTNDEGLSLGQLMIALKAGGCESHNQADFIAPKGR